jgi:hypothetical protein
MELKMIRKMRRKDVENGNMDNGVVIISELDEFVIVRHAYAA